MWQFSGEDISEEFFFLWFKVKPQMDQNHCPEVLTHKTMNGVIDV